MTDYEDEVERGDLAMQDHVKAQALLEDAVEQYQSNAEEAERLAEELYGAAETLEADAARAVGIFADYLMNDRAAMDDKAVELHEDAEDVEEAVQYLLDDAGADDVDEVYDVLTPSAGHRARLASMRHRVDNVYFD